MWICALSLLLSLASTADAETVRAVVSFDGAGAALTSARLAPGVMRAPRAGHAHPSGLQIEVLSADGEVLLAAPLPDGRLRTVPAPGGGGHATTLQETLAQVALPWPEGAAQIRLGEALLEPTTSPEPFTSPPALAPGGAASLIQESGPAAERLDMVFLGDGYTADEMTLFAEDVDRMVEYLLGIEPYGDYTGLFNIWRIDRASNESGATHYEDSPPVVRDTAYGCYYGCGGTSRLICCDSGAVLAALESLVPAYDGAMVLVNDPTYGGSGGSDYGTSYTDGLIGQQVAAHELGHSLIGLWDEYDYGYSWSGYDGPNCARDADALPWQHWLDEPGVGGWTPCSYSNYHRPTETACMMNTLQDGYCPVCEELAVLGIYAQIPRMLVSVDPPEGPVQIDPDGEPVTFTATALGPDDGAKWSWTLDGVELTNDEYLGLATCGDGGELILRVEDDTERVRLDPDGLMADQVSWTVSREPCADEEPGDSLPPPSDSEPWVDTGTSEPVEPVDPADSGERPGGCGCGAITSEGAVGGVFALLCLAYRRRQGGLA